MQAGGKYAEATGIVQSYAVEPTLSWEVSLFGALRRAKEAAKAEIAASAWALEGMRLSLAAEVATTYFTLLEYERNLSIARRTLQLRRESAALIDSMFRYGMSDGVALEQARSLVRTAEADIPQYRRAVVQTALSLGTLLGELPAQDTLRGEGLPLRTDIYPAEIPVGLPSELLRRRPDIREAHYGVAKAAVTNFTKYMCGELATKYGDGLRVNAIAPGFFITEQNRTLLLNPDGSYTERSKTILAHTPYGRFGEPSELLGTLQWLASDASKFVSGTMTVIDGGFDAFSI